MYINMGSFGLVYISPINMLLGGLTIVLGSCFYYTLIENIDVNERHKYGFKAALYMMLYMLLMGLLRWIILELSGFDIMQYLWSV